MAQPQPGNLGQAIRKPFEQPLSLQRADHVQLLLRRAARAHQVRVIRVREAVRLGARPATTDRSSKVSTVSPAPAAVSTASIASKPFA